MDIGADSQKIGSMGEGTDFFKSPHLSTSEDDSYYQKIRPTTTLDSSSPITYEFSTDDNHYFDISNCFHFLKFKIMKGDRITEIPAPAAGAADGDDQLVAPISYFANTCFENVELYLNSDLIETTNNLYPYKSYMQTVLSFGTEVKKGQLAAAGYFEDTDSHDSNAIRSTMHQDACLNKGLRERYKLTRCSKPFTLIAPLHLDLVNQKRYIQNRTSVKIRMSRSDPKFALLANANNKTFSFTIQEAYLMVRMVKPAPQLRAAVEEILESGSKLAEWPFKAIEMRYFSFPANSNVMSETSLYSGNLPNRFCLGLVKTEALNGHWQKSALRFDHCNISEMDVRVNGQCITSDPIKLNIAQNDHILPYFWAHQNTGGFLNNEALISYDQFVKGYNLFVFDITADKEHGPDLFHPPKNGVISIDIRITDPPDTGYSLIGLFEKEKILTCDKDRHYKIKG